MATILERRTSIGSRSPFRWLRLDALFAAAAVLIGFFLGAQTYSANLDSAQFYQDRFDPALAMLCNGRLEALNAQGAPLSFLSRESTTVKCADVNALPPIALNTFDRGTAYLFALAAGAWAVLGTTWANLFPVAGLLTAALAGASYALLRAFMPVRFVAAILAILVVSLAPVVEFIPHLRDFSKAPFIVGALAFMAWMVVYPGSWRAQLVRGLGLGVIVGLGLGFRADVLLLLPLAFFAPLLLLGTASWARTVKQIAAIWFGFGASFALMAAALAWFAPVPGTGGTFLAHVSVLGFAENFFHELSMYAADYRVFSPYTDAYVHGTLFLFLGDDPVYGSARYDASATALLLAMIKTVPGDVLYRILYAIDAIGRTGLNPLVWGPQFLAIAPFLLLTRTRAFLFLVLVIGYLAATMTLQFHPRHSFYMSVVGLALVVLTVESMTSTVVALWRQRGTVRLAPARMTAVVAALVLVIGLVLTLTYAASASQSNSLRELLASYQTLAWRDEPVSVSDEFGVAPSAGSPATTTPFGRPRSDHFAVFSKLQINMSDSTSESSLNCSSNNITVVLNYLYNSKLRRYQSWTIPTRPGVLIYFLPLIYTPYLHFAGIDIDGIDPECIESWSVAEDFPPGTLPVEMIALNGELHRDHRGDLHDVIRNFLAWP